MSSRADREDPRWQDRAACGEDSHLPPSSWDGEIFGEGRLSAARRERLQAAVRVCERDCPVREVCLADAIERREVGVVRGGRPFGFSVPKLPPRQQLEKRPRGGHQGRPVAPCGSETAANRHMRNKETLDEPCRLARNVAAQRRKEKAREIAARRAA